MLVDDDRPDVWLQDHNDGTKRLICSRAHIFYMDGLEYEYFYRELKEGDECPMEISYDKVNGSKYCRRILKDFDKIDIKLVSKN